MGIVTRIDGARWARAALLLRTAADELAAAGARSAIVAGVRAAAEYADERAIGAGESTGGAPSARRS